MRRAIVVAAGERGPVDRAHAQIREPGCERAALCLSEDLDREEGLVVVQGEHPVVLSCGGVPEDDIRRDRAADIESMLAGDTHRRLEKFALFLTHKPRLPRVWVETRERQARRLDA